jgi:hypothetical protein
VEKKGGRSETNTASEHEQGAKAYLQTLHGNKPEGTFILIWTLKDKKSFWAPTIEDALSYIEGVKDHDTYVGMGLARTKLKHNQRVKAADVAGITAIYADIDVAGDGHKKAGLPETLEDARKIADEMPCGPPSMIVHSGHGLQAYWVFKEPWLLPNSEENLKAQTFSKRFGDTLKARAAFYGYTIDSVFDLARVLRIPGTRNCKIKGAEVWAKIIECNPDIRYSRADLDKHMVPGDESATGGDKAESLAPVVTDHVILDPRAEPPAEKFDQLRQVDPEFLQVWEKARAFESASEYDQSLANRAARVNWEDQEITNLIIAWRRKHKEGLSEIIKRPDKIRRTIAKARAWVGSISDDDKEPRGSSPKKGGKRGPSIAQVVIETAESIVSDLFYDQTKEGFARVNHNGFSANVNLQSEQFKSLVAKSVYKKTGKVPSAQALNEAVMVLRGKALFEREQMNLDKRVGWGDDAALYYDIADNAGHVVRVTPNGWEVLAGSPTRFRRTAQQLPQVMPVPQGDIRTLLPLLQISENDQREQACLELCDLVVRFIPGIPQAIRVAAGDHGSGKSSRERQKKALVDPSSCNLSSLNTYRIDQAAHQLHSEYATVFDNVSSLTRECADLFCNVSTGGTRFRRKLYTDIDGIILDLQGVLVLTGINSPVIGFPDLLDRSVTFSYGRIDPAARREETEILVEFENARQGILGGIFNTLSKMMKIKPKLKTRYLPRMADYSLWAMAAAEALGFGADLFLKVYQGNIDQALRETIKANVVATLLLDILDKDGQFKGTISELLGNLNNHRKKRNIPDNVTGWPKDPGALGRKLTEIGPALAEFGFEVRKDRTTLSREISIGRILLGRESGDGSGV